MHRFAIVIVAAGLALSSALASQGRGQFGGESGSAPLVPELDRLPGTTQRGGGSYRSPGTEGATFELAATQSVTAIEEHYRKQLTAAGWKVESSGGDANIAYSRFTLPVAGSARAGTLVVTPIESGRLWVAVRVLQSMAVPAPLTPKTETEMMDWMLRQLPRPLPGEPPAVASEVFGNFPMELLPAGFKRSRILSSEMRVTVAGTLGNSRPSDLSTFFAALRKAGWSDRLRGWLTDTFLVAEFCRSDVRASIAFNVEPKRVVMAGISIDKPTFLRCGGSSEPSPGISGPIVVVPSEWSPANVDGGGSGSHWRAGTRLSTTTPVAPILADIESQIAASGYKATSRTGDANQSHVRFESTQMPGSSAIVLLSVTKLPWSPQIDAAYEVVTWPKR